MKRVLSMVVAGLAIFTGAASAGTPATVGGGWVFLVAHGPGVPSTPPGPFTFASTSPVLMTVTDLFCLGDRYSIYDGPAPLGTTSPSGGIPGCPPDEAFTPDAALADPRYSHGRFAIGAGAHAIDFVWTGPFGTGAGMAFRLDPLTRASCDNGGWQAITATPAFTSEADCVAFIGADTTPPVFAPRADVVANADSPDGAVVTYTPPSASDPDDAVASLTCAPASGSTFAIGSTPVTCTATDSAGNVASSSFTVHVRGADEQLVDLLAAVTGAGSGTSLSDKLTLAQSDLEANDLADTCSTLAAFIHEVDAQSDRRIPHGQAAALIAAAQRIRTVLGC
jgi:hypothetical protein